MCAVLNVMYVCYDIELPQTRTVYFVDIFWLLVYLYLSVMECYDVANDI